VSQIVRDNPVPTAPFWGNKCLEQIPLRAVLPYINRTALYRFQWGFKRGKLSEEEYARTLRSEVDPILNRLITESEADSTLVPQAIYGFFPCASDGQSLIIYTAPDSDEERCRFEFPRQPKGDQLCIADYFRGRETGERDVVAFQLVTVGQRASDFARELFHADRYQEYLYWHGLNAEGAEGLAEFVHKRVRAELGYASEDARAIKDLIKQKYRGARYSFGYPACPNLADQDKIMDLLDAERINVRLGDEDQLWPEESTTAIIVHHPAARYFGV
jgi:5-methyltetrahydrofolate--homocysteine methyltransferase